MSSKKTRAGLTQRQRKNRNKRMLKVRKTYRMTEERIAQEQCKPKNVARALRRHPPTTCMLCGADLAWFPQFGSYLDENDQRCPVGYGYTIAHLPANGRRPHPTADARRHRKATTELQDELG